MENNHEELQTELSLFLENIEEYSPLIEYENNTSILHKSVINPTQNSSILKYNLNKLIMKKCYPLVKHENNLMIWHEGVINPVQNSKLVMKKCNHLVEQDNSLMIEYESTQNSNMIGNNRIYIEEQ
ncbi:25625_t:CDS:2, partial [Racocetra persica]